MKRSLLMAAAMLALAACGPEASKSVTEPKIDELSSPRLAGRLYTCDITYFAHAGPISEESRAVVKMGIDTTPGTGGWQVVDVSVKTPLPDAGGFDPWLPFLPGLQRGFSGQDGSVFVLAIANGEPITFNALSGGLDWRVPGTLGDSGYRGGCF